jgi:hypothetical protein
VVHRSPDLAASGRAIMVGTVHSGLSVVPQHANRPRCAGRSGLSEATESKSIDAKLRHRDSAPPFSQTLTELRDLLHS